MSFEGREPPASTPAAVQPSVQHSAGKGSLTAEGTHAEAEAGTRGGGGPLPYLDQIQRSFGAHDVTGVRAHTGDDARRANAAMGSQAYARGNEVAFGGAPDLHTAAHEAAHVVQQRAGVHLKGGVGAAGDAYERHADAVADTVVAGGNAEGLLSEMAPTGARGGGAPAVQHFTGEEQRPEPAAPGAASNLGGDVVGRVRAACAAGDLAQITQLQHELRRKMLTDPLHPPQEARDGLALARCWTMERVAQKRDEFAPQLQTAQSGATTGTDNRAAVEAIEERMNDACVPYLDVLMHGDPQYRYLHPNQEVQNKVFAAVRLRTARTGESRVGDGDAAQRDARASAGLSSGAWCGAFAYAQADAAGGMDRHWRSHMHGEGGIRSALAYGGVMRQTWIWAFDDWKRLHDYHVERGSVRYYATITNGPPPQGIQPGDLVLKDNAFGTNPDHITTALTFDGRYLTTVGGNEGNTNATGVQRSRGIDLAANPDPNDVTLYDENHRAVTEDDGHGGRRRLTNGEHKNSRVHGIGRWSIVDYENHHYVISATKPAQPPAAERIARLDS